MLEERWRDGDMAMTMPGLASSTSLERRHLYLADHFAGARAGTALARHCRQVHRGRPAGPDFARLADDVERDLQWLEELLEVLGVAPSLLKQASAVVVERASRAKPNGQLLGRSPLSDLVELETLTVGVAGKRSLWLSLEASLATEPLDDVTLDQLVGRADAQLALLDTIRPALAAGALA